MMKHLYSAFSISKLFYHFVGDFGQTASRSLRFIDEIFTGFPQFRNFWKQGQTTTLGVTFSGVLHTIIEWIVLNLYLPIDSQPEPEYQ